MRQIPEDQLYHTVHFGVGRIGAASFQGLAVRDLRKRELAAATAADFVVGKLRAPLIFRDGAPVEIGEIRAMVSEILLGLTSATCDAARSGHQGTRRDAIGLITDRIIERLVRLRWGAPCRNKAGGEIGTGASASVCTSARAKHCVR